VADNETMSMNYPALKRAKIPFEIYNTDTLVKWLMQISECKPFVDENLGSPLEVNLIRKAKVRAITYSNQIEGNSLDEGEVTAVLKGRHVAGTPKDIKEIQNYHAALDYVEILAEDKRSLKISDLCDIQRLVTEGTIPEKQCGRIRTIPVSIVNAATGETIEKCPEPHQLKDLLADLWNWLSDTNEINPFIRAFAFHFIAVSIHPFADGNGRTVRLMQHLLLLRSGQKIARLVPSETAIMRARDRYYSAIRQSRGLSSVHPIVEFLAECFAHSAIEVVEEGRKLLRTTAGKTPQARHQKIISHAKKKKIFSIQDVIAWIPNVPRRTLERDLFTLVKNRSLSIQGETKSRTYSLRVS
jgi:Fic family protein